MESLGFHRELEYCTTIGMRWSRKCKVPPEEEESKKVEQIPGNKMKQVQKDCCDRSEIAEETKPEDGVRKRVEKGMG